MQYPAHERALLLARLADRYLPTPGIDPLPDVTPADAAIQEKILEEIKAYLALTSDEEPEAQKAMLEYLSDGMSSAVLENADLRAIEARLAQRGALPSREPAHDKFSRLSEQWYNASRLMSSARDMAMLPAYQKIIGMGWAAVPFILRELDQRPTHWFWALRAITDVDPVDPENKGAVDLMASQWVEWGRKLKLI